MSNQPQAVHKGITFWPIPVLSDPEVVFGLEKKNYFHRHELPTVPRNLEDEVSALFFKGGSLKGLAPKVNIEHAMRYMHALLASFAPAHEEKIATAAYALWVWRSEAITSA